MSSGATSHSKGHIFNEWGDCLNHNQVDEMCQGLSDSTQRESSDWSHCMLIMN